MNVFRYFAAFEDHFWKTEDQVKVFVTSNQKTIAYTPYVQEIIELLAPQGLPPFGAVLLVILATNQSFNRDLGFIDKIVRKKIEAWDTLDEYKLQHERALRDALDFLQILGQLPENYKVGAPRKALIQLLFEEGHNRENLKVSKEIAAWFEGILPIELEQHFEAPKKEAEHTRIVNELKNIARLGNKYQSVEQLIERLVELPTIDLDWNPSDEGEEQPLIDELLQHLKTYREASLIPYLWSGLRQVMPKASTGNQPAGGVADITNKGQVSQLLFSEFAQDNDVFLSRIANNEALYYQREKSSENEEQSQLVWIDVSLKNWGIPKLIGHAIGLAIQQHVNAQKQRLTIQSIGDSLVNCDYSTVYKVINTISHVEVSIDAHLAIQKAVAAETWNRATEITLVTTAAALESAAMQRLFSQLRAQLKWLVLVDRQGRIELHKVGRNNRFLLNEIQLNLEQIFQTNRPKIAKTAPLKAIEAIDEIPILFSLPHPPKCIATLEEERFLLSRNGNVYQLSKNPEKLLTRIKALNASGCNTLAVARSSTGDVWMVVLQEGKKKWHFFNLTAGTSESLSCRNWKPNQRFSMCFMDDCFYYRVDLRCWELNPKQSTAGRIYEDKKINQIVKKKSLYLEQRVTGKHFWGIKHNLVNIKNIGVNSTGQLVMGKFALTIEDGKPMWKTNLEYDIQWANRIEHRKFQFTNGSEVEVLPDGMLMLKQYTEQQFLLEISKDGQLKPKVQAYIHRKFNRTDLSLTDEAVFLKKIFSEEDALKHRLKLESLGASVKLNQKETAIYYIPTVLEYWLGLATEGFFGGNKVFLAEETKSQIIAGRYFYNRFISPFTQSILAHDH